RAPRVNLTRPFPSPTDIDGGLKSGRHRRPVAPERGPDGHIRQSPSLQHFDCAAFHDVEHPSSWHAALLVVPRSLPDAVSVLTQDRCRFSNRNLQLMKPPKETRRVEGRGRPEDGLSERTEDRTQSRKLLPSALARVHEAASRDKKARFTALLHHVN